MFDISKIIVDQPIALSTMLISAAALLCYQPPFVDLTSQLSNDSIQPVLHTIRHVIGLFTTSIRAISQHLSDIL